MRKPLSVLILFILLSSQTFPCTSAVISGKATEDGRPLLWKHRDTGATANKLVFSDGRLYDYVGVANLADTSSQQIWMGSNEVGFAIMNTASYNLNDGEVCAAPDDQEGLFMRTVLEQCASLVEFETYMDSTAGRWGLSANFGVIDAQGGAAYYEKGYHSYEKYDATDPEIAPDGYLLRTNFSFSGTEGEGYGFIRLDVTAELFKSKPKLNVEFMLSEATRNFHHGLMGNDLRVDDLPKDLDDKKFVLFQDYVVRKASASTLLIQGVLPEEDPQLTTLWTILGWQPVTLVTPVWVRSADLMPGLVTSNNGSSTPLNEVALGLKAQCFPIKRGNGGDYLLHSRLMNQAGTGFMDVVLPGEAAIITKTQELRQKWQKKGYRKRDLKKYNKWLDAYIRNFYQDELGQTIGE